MVENREGSRRAFDTELEQVGISPLFTPESVQKLTLYEEDNDDYHKNSLIQFERGSHITAYKLIRRGRSKEGEPNLIVDMKHR
jgi:hypothetical protein